MREKTFCVSALAFLLLSLGAGANPALASNMPVSDVSTFGTLAATLTPDTTLAGTGWTATLSEKVYLSGSIYTCVFTVLNSASSFSLSSFSTATVGASIYNAFSAARDFGIVTGAAFTTPGVSQGTGGCTSGGFCFGSSSLTLVPNSTANPGHLPAGAQITFYAQSTLSPTHGVFTTKKKKGDDDPKKKKEDDDDPPPLGPTPEPGSILLFGTGLLTIGLILRRRLLVV